MDLNRHTVESSSQEVPSILNGSRKQVSILKCSGYTSAFALEFHNAVKLGGDDFLAYWYHGLATFGYDDFAIMAASVEIRESLLTPSLSKLLKYNKTEQKRQIFEFFLSRYGQVKLIRLSEVVLDILQFGSTGIVDASLQYLKPHTLLQTDFFLALFVSCDNYPIFKHLIEIYPIELKKALVPLYGPSEQIIIRQHHSHLPLMLYYSSAFDLENLLLPFLKVFPSLWAQCLKYLCDRGVGSPVKYDYFWDRFNDVFQTTPSFFNYSNRELLYKEHINKMSSSVLVPKSTSIEADCSRALRYNMYSIAADLIKSDNFLNVDYIKKLSYEQFVELVKALGNDAAGVLNDVWKNVNPEKRGMGGKNKFLMKHLTKKPRIE